MYTMSARDTGEEGLSCTAKLARVVLVNRGPLSPREVASEACISVEEAREAITELTTVDRAEPVCGVRDTREQVYALTERDEAAHSERSA